MFNAMFDIEHISWIGISIVLIIVASILLIKYKVKLKYVLYTVTAIAFIDKAVTLFTGAIPTIGVPGMMPGTEHLPIDYLPFHLCAIQCFFMLAIIITKSDFVKNWLMAFTSVCMLMGAPFAILLPGYPMEFSNVGAYQMCITHSSYIVYAIYLIATKQFKIDVKILLLNLSLFLFLGFASVWLNSIINECGGYANFFYTMQPPGPNLPFLNLDKGWEIYFLRLSILAILLITLFHLPFLIIDYRKKKKENNYDKNASLIS